MNEENIKNYISPKIFLKAMSLRFAILESSGLTFEGGTEGPGGY